MSKYSATWFWQFSPRNGGDLADISDETRERVLNNWALGRSKSEIMASIGIHANTIRKVTRQAREKADPRGFARLKAPIMSPCASVLELRNYVCFIKALAVLLDMHYMQVEKLINQALRDVNDRNEGK
jgi:hypothetical protein